MKNDKCETCFNARWIISENGRHPLCMFSDRKALTCEMNEYQYWIQNPNFKNTNSEIGNELKTITDGLKTQSYYMDTRYSEGNRKYFSEPCEYWEERDEPEGGQL